MRIEDLMIGDWVAYNLKPYTVDSLKRYNSAKQLEDGSFEPEIISAVKLANEEENTIGMLYQHSLEYILAIPITHEILEANGYKFNGLWYERDGYPSIEIGLYIGEYNIGKENLSNKEDPDFDTFVKIEYVHELQHVFKLFKVKDDIKLSKEHVV